MTTTKFLQVLRVEDFHIEAGVSARPGPRGSEAGAGGIRIWLWGSPATQFSKVTTALLQAVDVPPPPRYEFHRKRIEIAYAPATIAPVVSMLLDGVQLFAQYREFEGGGIHADVHRPRHKVLSAGADMEPHWHGLPER
ncbi:MAG: hypothetical protein K0V04_33475 [Deltaproteobacteria bacterium]|nr:hypothetical protein [Deltaproteobacteria bacterium]